MSSQKVEIIYESEFVNDASTKLAAAGVVDKVMVDFSHANSAKQYKRQLDVCADVATQISSGNDALFAVMVESHLVEGQQKVVAGEPLTYGQSITDACIGWDDTETIMAELAEAVLARRALKAK